MNNDKSKKLVEIEVELMRVYLDMINETDCDKSLYNIIYGPMERIKAVCYSLRKINEEPTMNEPTMNEPTMNEENKVANCNKCKYSVCTISTCRFKGKE